MTKEYDAVVIGSGISGLTSALLLAKRGKKVAIAEQAPHIAPLIAGFERNKVHFETGFHYSAALGEHEIGGILFKELGLDIPVELCDPDNYDEIRFIKTGKVFKLPIGREKLEKRLKESFPEEKNISRYLDFVSETVKKVPFLKADNANLSFEDLLNFYDDGKTLKEILDEYFKDENLKTILSFPSVWYGTTPDKMSFVLHCCCWGLAIDSLWKVKGGAKTVVNAYREALEKNGADIFVNKKAVKIEAAENKKSVLFEDGEVIKCGMCIASVHPKEFMKIAPEGAYRKKYKQRVETIEDTPSFFVLYGFLKGEEKYKHTNIAFSGGYPPEDFFNQNGTEPYYINFSDTDPQAVCVVSFVKPDEKYWDKKLEGYKEKKRDTADTIKKRLRDICPEIADKIEYCDTATPATFKRYVNYYGGYGIVHDVNNIALLPITKTPGVFLAGQAVVTPGLLGAMTSSFILDKMIQRGRNDS